MLLYYLELNVLYYYIYGFLFVELNVFVIILFNIKIL